MSRNGRRALFYLFCLIFLVLGTGIILFAQGWRMDFPSFHMSKVGGIYVRSYPEGAAIFLNGKFIPNRPGILSRGTLISDLFPRTYRLALTAPNYRDWNENIAVLPSLVSNHTYAVLIPAHATDAVTSSVADFVASHGSVLLESTGGKISLDGKTIGFGKLIATSPDLQSVVFQNTKGVHEFADTQSGAVTNLSNILSGTGFTSTAPQLFFNPAVNSAVIAVGVSRIGLLDMTQPTGTLVGTSPRGQVLVPSVAVSPNTVAWASVSNKFNATPLFFYDLSSSITVSTTIALDSNIKKLIWITGNLLGILTEHGSFYLYDTNQENLKKLADDVRSVSVATGGSRIAMLESRSLEIFTLGDPQGYYRFNLPDVGAAQAALWYRDNDHLFISYPDQVSFLDLQDAGLANFITVAQGTAPQYDPDANTLYLKDAQNHLLRSDFAK